eukprot:1811105-Pyramimonas_sp.AAC.1
MTNASVAAESPEDFSKFFKGQLLYVAEKISASSSRASFCTWPRRGPSRGRSFLALGFDGLGASARASSRCQAWGRPSRLSRRTCARG